jgi:hypothetical protein
MYMTSLESVSDFLKNRELYGENPKKLLIEGVADVPSHVT